MVQKFQYLFNILPLAGSYNPRSPQGFDSIWLACGLVPWLIPRVNSQDKITLATQFNSQHQISSGRIAESHSDSGKNCVSGKNRSKTKHPNRFGRRISQNWKAVHFNRCARLNKQNKTNKKHKEYDLIHLLKPIPSKRLLFEDPKLQTQLTL